MSQSWSDADYPRQPQHISRALRKLTRRVNQSRTSILFTNQVRTRFQQGAPVKGARPSLSIKADDYTSPGGLALRFYASHRIFMFSYMQNYKLIPDGSYAAGLLVGFHTKKNRIRPPLRDGRMVLLFDQKEGGLHNVFSMLETMVDNGFIEVASETKHTGYTCRFIENNINPTTFDREETETSLEEDENTPRRGRGSKKNPPGFKTRSEWPEYYNAHQADLDALWQATVDFVMSIQGMRNSLKLEEEYTPMVTEEAT